MGLLSQYIALFSVPIDAPAPHAGSQSSTASCTGTLSSPSSPVPLPVELVAISSTPMRPTMMFRARSSFMSMVNIVRLTEAAEAEQRVSCLAGPFYESSVGWSVLRETDNLTPPLALVSSTQKASVSSTSEVAGLNSQSEGHMGSTTIGGAPAVKP